MGLDEAISRVLVPKLAEERGVGVSSRMQKLMASLGNPQNDLRVIHVAGTSGKTSTSYMITALLKEAGKTVALTVSPHVDTVRERAMINLASLAEKDWELELREFIVLMNKHDCVASYFEFYMAFAFWLAKKRKVDYMVVETGVGGRCDASNVIENPDKVAVLTDVGLDHTNILGNSLAEITAEKLGIVKSGNTLLLNRQTAEVMNEVERVMQARGGDLVVLNTRKDDFWLRNFALARAVVDLVLRRDACALPTVDQIERAFRVQVPARAELLHYKGREVILDASHNPQKLQALADYLGRYGKKKRILVLSLAENKAETALASFRVMRKLADDVIITDFKEPKIGSTEKKALPLAEMKNYASAVGFSKIRVEPSAKKALDVACDLGFEQVVVTGSFYLLNQLRPCLIKKSQDDCA